MNKKIAYIFPGQGAQSVAMGQDFYQQFPVAKRTFEEADDLLRYSLSTIIFEGPEDELTKTRYSQPAIFVVSLAILRVIQQQYPNLQPYVCSGLSLGEYSALEAGGWISFQDGLSLVQKRALLMNEACEKIKGSMAAILGLDAKSVENEMKKLHPQHQVWAANYNCPGQVVISGTREGVQVGIQKLMERGAKKAIPLDVHGAFHSGLMQEAQDKLQKEIENVHIKQGKAKLVMNVTGDFAQSIAEVRKNLLMQITSSVRWQQGVERMDKEDIDMYLEIGCGKTLASMNRKIKVKGNTLSIASLEDLEQLQKVL